MIFVLILISCSKKPTEEVYQRFSEGVNLYYGGLTEEALKVFKELNKEYPDMTVNTEMYARSLFFTGKENQAVTLWETLDLYKNPDLDTVKTLGAWYLENNRPDKAVPLLDMGLGISSEDPLLLFLKARACKEDGELELAISFLLSGLTMMEKQIVIPLELARIYSSFGMQSESMEILLRYSQFLPSDHPLQAAVDQLTESVMAGPD